jgi:hypothetical protein
MKNQEMQIAEKLSTYIESFKSEANSLKKVIIIHDYVEYVKNNDKLSKLLKDIITRSENNVDKILKKEIEGLTLKELGYKNGQFVADDIVWILFCFFLMIYKKMKDYKEIDKDGQKEIEKWLGEEVVRPDILIVVQTFFIILHQYILTLLNKEIFLSGHSSKIFFDELHSILYFFGEPVKISKQDDRNTVAHQILKYIFIDNKDNLHDDFFYSEMHELMFDDEKYKPEKYYIACRDIQEKIRAKTAKKIEDFLVFNTGKKGKVKLNKIYLKSML